MKVDISKYQYKWSFKIVVNFYYLLYDIIMNYELPMRDELIERYLCVQNYYGGCVRNYKLS